MARADVDISVGINDKAVVAALDKISTKLDRFGKQAQYSSRQAQKGITGMTDALFLFERRISNVTRAFQLLGAGAALSVFKNFVDSAQSANNAIKSISETQDQFNALQKETLRIANATGESYRATATGIVRVYRSIEDLGYNADTAIKVVETLNKTLLVSGATGSEATSTLIQFTQALQSGVLQGDELRSLRENAPLAMKAIAKAAGVTTGELKKLGTQGKLTTELLAKAFTNKEFIKDLDEMRNRMDLTFSQSVQIATNNFAVFFAKLEESTGVLKTLGNGLVLLSNSFNAIAANKFVLIAPVFLFSLVKINTAIVALGGYALTMSSAFTVAGIAISRARIALVAFMAANAPMIAISAVVLAIAAAFDSSARAAAAAQEKISKISEEFAQENMKFNDFLTEEQLNQLTKAQATLKINQERITELNKAIETNTQLLSRGREEADIGRLAAIRRAQEEKAAIEATTAALQDTVQKWKEYAKAVESSQNIRGAITDIQARAEQEKNLLDIAKEKKKTGSQELAEYDVWLRNKREEISLETNSLGFNKARLALLENQLTAGEQGRKDLQERLKLEEKVQKVSKPKSQDAAQNLLRSYTAELDKAKLSASGYQQVIDAMDSGISEDSLNAKRESIALEEQIIDLRKQYAKLPGGTADLENQLRANLTLNSSYRDSVKVYQQLNEARAEMVAVSFEEYAASQELAALKTGASAQQIEDLRAELAIREKFNALGENEIQRQIAIDKARRDSVKVLDNYYKSLEDVRRAGEAIGTTIGQALADIAAQAATAEDALKRVVAQLLEAIAQAAILSLFNQSGSGGFWGDVISGIGGGRSASQSNVRIINMTGGGITTRRSGNGDTTVLIGAAARDITRGGTALSLAIERTYGVRRQGV
jgi:tape measure domain-containing protein